MTRHASSTPAWRVKRVLAPVMAAKMGKVLGAEITFFDVPFDFYRGLGFPGAGEVGVFSGGQGLHDLRLSGLAAHVEDPLRERRGGGERGA